MSSVVISSPLRLARIAAPFLFILLGVIYAAWSLLHVWFCVGTLSGALLSSMVAVHL